MAGAAGPVHVVGRLGTAQPYIGLARAADGYALVVGSPEHGWQPDPTSDPLQRRTTLLCLAVVYFLDGVTDPPPALEATQADIARLVESMARTAAGAVERALFQEALDAIDDGLAADAVALSLQRLLPPGVDPELELRGLTWRLASS